MNVFEAIYCSQYNELKKTGRDPLKGRTNGTILIAAMLTLLLIAAVVLVGRFSSQGSALAHFFLRIGLSGRSVGKVLAFGLIAATAGILHFTIGSPAAYAKMIARWEQMSDDVLKAAAKKALIAFVTVFVLFLIAMLMVFMS